MPKWDRNRVVSLLLQAGRIALDQYGHAAGEFKRDRTIVTEADKAVESFLTEELENTAEDSFLIGEETCAEKSAAYLDEALFRSSSAWIVDPIDGTAMYAAGIPLWGVSIGYAEHGVIREGGIYMPCTGELLISGDGAAWYAEIRPGGMDFPDFRQLDRPPQHLSGNSAIALSQLAARRIVNRIPCQQLCLGSAVAATMYFATGRIAGMIHRAKLWDHAGAIPPLRNLGATAKFSDGHDLMDGVISDASYELDYESMYAFRLRETITFGASEEIRAQLAEKWRIVPEEEFEKLFQQPQNNEGKAT